MHALGGLHGPSAIGGNRLGEFDIVNTSQISHPMFTKDVFISIESVIYKYEYKHKKRHFIKLTFFDEIQNTI